MKTTESLDSLIDDGSILQCPSCNAYNAYAWCDVNMDPNTHEREPRDEDNPITMIEENVYHIPAASCFDWQCGKCGTPWAEADSPIMAEVYTHVPQGVWAMNEFAQWTDECPKCHHRECLVVYEVTQASTGIVHQIESELYPDGFVFFPMDDGGGSTEEEKVRCDSCGEVFDLSDLVL